ncbi:hypothetical protein ACFYZ9_24340 [Streptomyces sp. NPDC001691]|uniref:hypothetical protein n=1 Tax=Streptomyces sp. NPDC001691 TaxID=3364600 RepID=UPI00368E6FC6
MPPQSEAVGPDINVIIVGVGGNAIGFADLVNKCVALGSENDGDGAPARPPWPPASRPG